MWVVGAGTKGEQKGTATGLCSAFVVFAHLLTDSLQAYLIVVAVGVTVGGLPSCWSGSEAEVCAEEEGRVHGAHTCPPCGSPASGLCVGRGPESGTEG